MNCWRRIKKVNDQEGREPLLIIYSFARYRGRDLQKVPADRFFP